MNVILCGDLRSNRAARSTIAGRIGAGHMILISAAPAAAGKRVMPAAIANARAPNGVSIAILHRISAPGSEQGIVPAKTRALEGSGWPLAAHARPPPGFDYRLSRNGRMRSVMEASSEEPLSA